MAHDFVTEPSPSAEPKVSTADAASVSRATRGVRLYEVTIRMWGQTYTRPVSARSASAARYRAYLEADLSYSFAEYLRLTSVRLAAGVPLNDGYDYIRRAYGINPQIGQRVTLTGEGKDWEGREGEVVYPGTSRQYVHLMFGDLDNPVVVHPRSIVFPATPQGIEARSDETQSGSAVGKSPVGLQSDAPVSLPDPPPLRLVAEDQSQEQEEVR